MVFYGNEKLPSERPVWARKSVSCLFILKPQFIVFGGPPGVGVGGQLERVTCTPAWNRPW